MLARVPPPLGIDLLFVDGEDYGPSVDDMFLGARRYAASLDEMTDRPVYGLLLDMVGDADPSFPVEEISAQQAEVVVRKVWRAAEALNHTSRTLRRAPVGTVAPGGERGLVAPLVFKTSGTGEPRPVGSIPATSAEQPDAHLRCPDVRTRTEMPTTMACRAGVVIRF